jgi:formylglycine-generating enzyme required for sulfatase activity
MHTDLPPEYFPPHLAQLDFQGYVNRGVEYILPPLCKVPAGPFLMGSDPKRDHVAAQVILTDLVLGLFFRAAAKERRANRERPQHTVTLPAYEIARYPVTVAEYACFVRAGHAEPNDWQTQLSKLDHPVVRVTWHDAVAYTAWLSERTGEWWRLPTEAEWEKAARGTDGRIYPWGDTFDTARCNSIESGGIRATTPVGSYSTGASPYGVQDMAGNVWEWTGSLKLPYPYTLSGEREDPNSTGKRVLRGGSWLTSVGGVRAAYRISFPPTGLVSRITGFRVVRAAPTL